MAENRHEINSSDLDKVVGGALVFHSKSLVLDYVKDDGTTTKYKILDLNKAWELSNQLHAKFVPESQIIAQMISNKYIQG